MRNLFKLLFFLILPISDLSATSLTGTFKTPDGVVVNGTITFTASQVFSLNSTGGCGGPLLIVPNKPSTFTLTNGVPKTSSGGTPVIYGNDCVTPIQTYYIVTVRDTTGLLLFTDTWYISGSSLDLGTVPTVAVPSGQSIFNQLVVNNLTVTNLTVAGTFNFSPDIKMSEGACIGAAIGFDIICADSTSHSIKTSLNNGAFTAIPQIAGDLGGTAANPTVLITHLTSALPVNQGGTGNTTLANHGILVGATTAVITQLSVGVNNTVLHGNTGADPSFSSVLNADMATTPLNTVKANFTSDSATPTDFTMPSCPDSAGNHLNYLNGTGVICGTASETATAHNLLSATHGDTTAASAIRGDGIFAIGATPKWQRLAHPSVTGGYYKWNGTDIVASTLAASGTGSCGANQFETADNADGAPTCAQPTSSNISGLINNRSVYVTGCNGTALANGTVTMPWTGEAVMTCLNTTTTLQMPATSTGTGKNLKVRCSSGGINSSSGVFTLVDGGGNTSLTCTTGTSTTCSDTTHGPTVTAGDLLLVQFTTQIGETLANCAASFEIQ